MTTLNTIRYYTADDGYHYTIDNRPLQDLEQNDIALKVALDSLTNNTTTSVSVGNWTTLQVVLDLHQELNKAFAYKIRFWAIEDQIILPDIRSAERVKVSDISCKLE